MLPVLTYQRIRGGTNVAHFYAAKTWIEHSKEKDTPLLWTRLFPVKASFQWIEVEKTKRAGPGHLVTPCYK